MIAQFFVHWPAAGCQVPPESRQAWQSLASLSPPWAREPGPFLLEQPTSMSATNPRTTSFGMIPPESGRSVRSAPSLLG